MADSKKDSGYAYAIDGMGTGRVYKGGKLVKEYKLVNSIQDLIGRAKGDLTGGTHDV